MKIIGCILFQIVVRPNSFVEAFSIERHRQSTKFFCRKSDTRILASFLPSNSILLSSSSPEEEDRLISTNNNASNAGDVLSGFAKKDSILEDTKIAEEKKIPIDLPSPILLALTIITAIISAGSIFNVIGGQSDNVILSLSIGTVGTPLSFLFFYGAILKGIAETEEDDEKFLRGR